MALEPRVMFDGAVAATAAQLPHGPDPVAAAEPHALAAERAEFRLAPAGLRADMVSMRALSEHDVAPLAGSSVGRDVLFIDARVKDADSLLAHVAAGTEVVYLQQSMDGLQQMANYLDAHPGARSVQIITHGNDGDLWLGSTYLSADNVGQHADALARIGADIQTGGDLLIYACDTAAGDKGLSFVASLADLTHRDVAASSNRIGAGYDWNLEVTTGTIDSRQVLSAADEAGYAHDLAIITVTNNADAGIGSLRAAIVSASASGDTITFNAGMTINLSTHASGDTLLLINKNLTIEGDIDGNGTADVTLDGQYNGRVLEISSGKTVTLDGLIIQHGLVAGDGGNGGAGAAAALGGGIFNAGNLTLNNVAVTANAASAGGGGGGVTSAYPGGGGGGGGGIGGGIGGRGGSTGSGTGNYAGVAGSANTGGRGGGYDAINMGGRGGSSTGGAGGIGTYSYTNGGNGGTASNGSISIGGGGGGAGWDAHGGIGGNAVGGIYNAGTGVLTIIGTSVISNNLGAGGGGGGGSANGSSTTFDGGDGGVGVGGILNNGGTVNITAANFAAMTGNAGGSGIGGSATGGSNGITPGSADMLGTLGGGTIDTAYSPLAITSATYNAATGVLAVTGTNMTVGDTIDSSKLTLTGEGGATYTLTSSSVTASSATSFSITLNVTDQAALNQIINKNGTSATGGTSFNLAAAANWDSTAAAGADATNTVTASNVAVPTITSATFDASTGVLVVTGTGFTHLTGASNDIVANKFTLTGEGGATYTLTDTANVEITSGTSFTLTLSATDRAAINRFFNKNGTSSTGGTTYNVAAAEDWAAGADAGVVVADTTGNGITVSSVAVPTITSATYNEATGAVIVTGTGFKSASGATNDIVANKFTFTGEGGATYTLTDTFNVEITSGTSFTLSLSATDKAALNQFFNKNGTSSTGGTTYNLAAAEDWAAGADAAVVVADTTGNGITVASVAVPAITSATFDASTGSIVVTGTGFLSAFGASNDIVANKFTFTGEGGTTYTLTDTSNVEITSGTSFTLTLSATDKAGINLIVNKNGTSSTGGTTFNLAAAEDWAAGADTAVVIADTTGNGMTVSNVAVPTITSATFDASTGVLVVTGTGFHSAAGATNDIVANKFTLTGDGGATYTLTDTANVEITSGTSFTMVLSVTDKAAILPLLNKNGTVSAGTTTYNLAAAEDWAAGADAAVVVADLTGNGITASNVDSTPPAVASVVLPFNSTYVAGQNLDFTVSFGEKVFVNTGGGTPYIDITLDSGGTAHAIYLLGSGSKFLTFRYTVASGDADATGIALAGAISANGTTLKDPTGNNATLTLNGVGSTAGLKVDAVAPTVSSVSAPADASYATGQNLDFTVNFSETVYVNTGGGTPRIALTLDTGGTVYATYVSGSGSSALTFRYTIATGNMDTDGITVGSVVAANGGTVRDAGGNYATLTLNGVGSTAGVLVDTLAPSVNTINRVTSATTSATSVDYTVTFAESVTGVDASDFALTATGTASGAIASVTQVNGSTYTVTVNTITGDGTLRLDLNGSGTGIADLPGNAIKAGYTSGQTYSFDHTAPTVASVGVPANATYSTGDNLDFTINLNEAVTVDTAGGTPRIAITLDTGGTVYADYLSGSGTSALTFRYTVATGVADANGITVGALAANGGTLKDAAGNNATLTLNSVGSTAAVLVDAAAPAVLSVDVPADGTYGAGNNLDFTINFSEAVTVTTGGGTPRVAITLDTGGTVYADYLSGSGTAALTFRYTIGAGTLDTNGITVGALSANGGTLKDAASNDAALTLNNVGSTTAVLVDAVAPSVSSINRVTGATTNATSVDYTVTFAESVTGVDAADFALIATGTASGSIASVTQVNGSTYTVTVSTITGNGTLRLDLNGSGTGIADTAGNAITAGYTSGQTYSLDHTAPAVNSVSVPANATYGAGDNLDFTVNLNEAVTVDTAGGTPRIAITLDTGGTVYADYLSGSGTSALTFRYTVAAGMADANGIAVGALAANGGTLKDAAGNNATLTLNSVGSTAAVLVDAAAPTASIVVADTSLAAGETSLVTITFSEAVSGFTNDDLAVANGSLSAVTSSDGGVTWTATFTPANGTTDASNLITLDNTGVADTAGNTGTGSTASNNYAIDTQRPTASIVVADTVLAAGETSQVTITFSEAVSGLTAADFNVANGTVSGLSSSDGGITWTATFAPASDVADASNLITLDNTGVQDAAGNTGVGSTVSNNYTIDTQAPQVLAITRNDASINSAQQGLSYTITFSEDVSGVDIGDLQLVFGGSVRATIDSLVQVDGHTYVVKLSNVGGSGSLRLDLIAQASGIVDGASNALAAGVQGEIYTVGGVAPVILASEAPLLGATASASIFTPPADLMGLPQLSERDLPTLFFADAAPLQSQGRPLLPGTFGAAGVVTFDAERTEAFADHVRDRFALPQSAFIEAGRPFVVALPASSLGRGSVVQATLADGRPLPAWLRFDPVAGTLEGTAPAGFRERLTLQLLLVDADGRVQSLTLELDPSAPADVHAKPSKEAQSAQKPTASGKPALQEQFGSQRHAGGVDHAALLHQLAIAQRHHVTQVAP